LNALPGYKRYLYPEIDNALKGRLTGIVGSRGTGKTTLMLQVIKEYYGNSDKALYVSVDHPYFETGKVVS
ncbi:MAG: AAA family ATPase, partial [Deltaproteobacteria bacterium]|nr:AAA family ATPase [Deltaproteobacteria bacterium]